VLLLKPPSLVAAFICDNKNNCYSKLFIFPLTFFPPLSSMEDSKCPQCR
jgi:hypothetical protein